MHNKTPNYPIRNNIMSKNYIRTSIENDISSHNENLNKSHNFFINEEDSKNLLNSTNCKFEKLPFENDSVELLNNSCDYYDSQWDFSQNSQTEHSIPYLSTNFNIDEFLNVESSDYDFLPNDTFDISEDDKFLFGHDNSSVLETPPHNSVMSRFSETCSSIFV